MTVQRWGWRQGLRALAVGLGLALSLGWVEAAEAKLRVVATLPDLAAVAREVGGEDAEVTALAGPTVDPHFVDARPSLILPLNRAQLVVLTGLDLEVGWLPTLIQGARNGRLLPGTSGYFDASTVVPLKQVPTMRVNRAMGDIHPGGNPHFMSDPRNAARVARALARRMGALEPARIAAFQARGEAFAKACEVYAAEGPRRFQSLPARRRQVVVFHQSLIYALDWLGLTQVNTLEPKPGIAPSPEHVATVLGQMRELHVPAIFQETYRPRSPGDVLSRLAQARQVILPGGPEEGQSYLRYLKAFCDAAYAGVKP